MAAADLNTIRSTIEGRLATELANSPVLPVVFHNMAYEPTPGSSWVQCQTSFGANEYLGHGLTTSGYNRILGQMVINIFTPKGTGPGANYVIGKRVRDLYNRVTCRGFSSTLPSVQRYWLHQLPRAIFKLRSV